MPKGMQAIYTQTVGSGGASVVTFNNIPQTYTDLLILVSARTGYSGDADAYMFFQDGAGTGNYSWTKFQGFGNGTTTYRASNAGTMSVWTLKGDGTANTFSNTQINIPNYTSSLFKSVASDTIMENNGTIGFCTFTAGLWRSNLPVTAVSFNVAGNLLQNSTFTLYGISR
jgi:hypothetical protein